jgi:outer membrane protein assembly factor BamE (lipoprotein component of BamABCDE complex)
MIADFGDGMTRLPPLASTVALALILVATCGCTRIRDTQGYLADEELLGSVQPGVDNRDSVNRALGRPTFLGQWNDNAWYYVSRNTRQFAFLKSRPAEQNILIVRFRADGTVDSVERRGLEQVADIAPDRDRTPTLGRETSILEDLFGNIGTVGAAPGAGGPPQ